MKDQKKVLEESGSLAEELEQKMGVARPLFSVPIFLLKMGASDARLRTKFLEFVDVLPSLTSTYDIREHFEMYLGPFRSLFPLPLRLGSYAMKVPLIYRLAASLVKWIIYNRLAPYFIFKDEGAVGKLRRRYEKDGGGVIVDVLGELVVSQREADYFFNKYLGIMHRAHLDVRFLEWDKGAESGYGHPFHIAVKLSSLYPFFSPENHEESKRRVQERFEEILRQAQKYNAFVTVDAEHYDYKALIEDIFCSTILKPEFRHTTQVGIALQAYLKSSFLDAMRLLDVAKERGAPFTIRLTKGAYWDTEVAYADQRDWPVPVLQKKWQSDRSFDTILYYLIRHWEYVHVSPATHNPENIAFAIHAARESEVLDDPNFTFQVLYGLGESARKVLGWKNLPVLVYTPVGDLETGMSYFARRILENTANEGFLLRLIQGNKEEEVVGAKDN